MVVKMHLFINQEHRLGLCLKVQTATNVDELYGKGAVHC